MFHNYDLSKHGIFFLCGVWCSLNFPIGIYCNALNVDILQYPASSLFSFHSYILLLIPHYIYLSHDTNEMIKHLRVIQLISLLTSVSDLICKVVDLECMNLHLRCVNSRSYSFSFGSEHTAPLLGELYT